MKTSDILAAVKSWFSDWRGYLAEFLATTVFVFVAILAVLSNQFYGQISVLGVALAIGFCYTALIFASVHTGGGYLNPAAVVALWLAGRVSHLRAITLICVQTLASFAAAGLIFAVFGQNASRFLFGLPEVGVGVSLASTMATEAILVAAFVYVIFATGVDRRGPVSFSALALGIFLTGATVISLPISGAILNPARVIGPAVFAKSWEGLTIWLIGPLAGSLMGLVYELIFLRKKKG